MILIIHYLNFNLRLRKKILLVSLEESCNRMQNLKLHSYHKNCDVIIFFIKFKICIITTEYILNEEHQR